MSQVYARQLTTSGHEGGPIFSPDGKWIAFAGEYDGNTDVFVMPAGGGEPRRLTWHPGPDVPVAWTTDGKRILFNSPRDAYADTDRLYTVPIEGGWPEGSMVAASDNHSNRRSALFVPRRTA